MAAPTRSPHVNRRTTVRRRRDVESRDCAHSPVWAFILRGGRIKNWPVPFVFAFFGTTLWSVCARAGNGVWVAGSIRTAAPPNANLPSRRPKPIPHLLIFQNEHSVQSTGQGRINTKHTVPGIPKTKRKKKKKKKWITNYLCHHFLVASPICRRASMTGPVNPPATQHCSQATMSRPV